MYEILRKNIWNIISSVGTFATLFFGIIGLVLVPSYVNDAYKQKQVHANMEIITDLQELLYYNKMVDYKTINTIKRGEEIKYGIDVPLTTEELLIEVQESFMDKKFLQLGERKTLFDRIDSIRVSSPSEITTLSKSQSKNNLILILIYIASGLSILVSVLLFAGVLFKRRQQMNEEIQKKFEEIEETKPESIINYRSYENKVSEMLKKLNLDFEDITHKQSDSGFDFIIKHNNRTIAIEVKSRINTDIAKKLKVQFDKSGVDALIVISNKIIDYPVFSLISDIQKSLHVRPIYFISGVDFLEIEREITQILNAEKK
jgi:hypothetical protein